MAVLSNECPWREGPLYLICGCSFMHGLFMISISHRDSNAESSVKFTYTAMHGVGYDFVVDAQKTFGFPSFIPVKEQVTKNIQLA